MKPHISILLLLLAGCSVPMPVKDRQSVPPHPVKYRASGAGIMRSFVPAVVIPPPAPLEFTVQTNAVNGLEYAVPIGNVSNTQILWMVQISWLPRRDISYIVERRDQVIAQWCVVSRILPEPGVTPNYASVTFPVMVPDPGEWRVLEE